MWIGFWTNVHGSARSLNALRVIPI